MTHQDIDVVKTETLKRALGAFDNVLARESLAVGIFVSSATARELATVNTTFFTLSGDADSQENLCANHKLIAVPAKLLDAATHLLLALAVGWNRFDKRPFGIKDASSQN